MKKKFFYFNLFFLCAIHAKPEEIVLDEQLRQSFEDLHDLKKIIAPLDTIKSQPDLINRLRVLYQTILTNDIVRHLHKTPEQKELVNKLLKELNSLSAQIMARETRFFEGSKQDFFKSIQKNYQQNAHGKQLNRNWAYEYLKINPQPFSECFIKFKFIRVR